MTKLSRHTLIIDKFILQMYIIQKNDGIGLYYNIVTIPGTLLEVCGDII